MQIVPSTFLAFVALVYIAIRGPYRGLWVFLALTPFGAAAAVNLPALGGASIMAMDLVAALMFVMVVLSPDGVARVLGTMRVGQPGFFLLLLVGFSIVSALLFPRVFQGWTETFAIARSETESVIVMTPLHATTGNLTQLFRIFLDAMTFLALATVFRLRPDPGPVLQALVVATLVHGALGAADVLSVDFGRADILNVIRTANYSILAGSTMAGLTRMVGGFPEASSFGYYALGLFGFWLQYWISGARRGLGLGMLVLSGFLLLRSTSSASYVALVAYLISFGLWSVFRRSRGLRGVDRRAVALAVGGILAAWIVVIGLFLAYQTIDSLSAYLDNVLFDKASSQSGIERLGWNIQAWQNFRDTWLMGAGLGSVRASNWLLASLASLGLIGTAIFLAFLAAIARLGTASAMPERDALVGALKSACLAMFLSAMLTTSTPDFGVFFFALAGLAAGLSRGGQRESVPQF